MSQFLFLTHFFYSKIFKDTFEQNRSRQSVTPMNSLVLSALAADVPSLLLGSPTTLSPLLLGSPTTLSPLSLGFAQQQQAQSQQQVQERQLQRENSEITHTFKSWLRISQKNQQALLISASSTKGLNISFSSNNKISLAELTPVAVTTQQVENKKGISKIKYSFVFGDYDQKNILRLLLTVSGFFDWRFPTLLLKLPRFSFSTALKAPSFHNRYNSISKAFLFPFGLDGKGRLSAVSNALKGPQVQILFIPYAFAFGIFYTISSVNSLNSFPTLPTFSTFPTLPTSLEGLEKLKGLKTVKKINTNVVVAAIERSSKATTTTGTNYCQILAYETLRLGHYSSKIFLLWSFLKIWKGIRPADAYRNEVSIKVRVLSSNKNKKKLKDVVGIEKFLPVLTTLVDSISSSAVIFNKSKKNLIDLVNPLSSGRFSVGSLPSMGSTSSKLLLSMLSFAQRRSRLLLSMLSFAQRRSRAATPLSTVQSVSKMPQLVLPKAYVFVGSPGTGKTLLAQAVAGEASVNLICLSASEIQKQIDIGTRVGALRVRNLFETARKNTPCILFLDEIDSIAGSREPETSFTDEKTQETLTKDKNATTPIGDTSVLTEFLIQMDNFSVQDGFILIGTTNFLSRLDGAFIRSGRFDRIIGLQLPSKKIRIELLKLYISKSKLPFSDSSYSVESNFSSNRNSVKKVDLFTPSLEQMWEDLALRTKGFTAADLSKVVNESSLHVLRTSYLLSAQNSVLTSPFSLKERFGLAERAKTNEHTFQSLLRGILKISSRDKFISFVP